MNVRLVYTSLLLALLYLLLLGSISPAVSASPISPSEKGKGKKLEQPTEPSFSIRDEVAPILLKKK
ncbi:hypothetical protein TYRP_003497 [Tyrophagus putrescentiae]|nr:hypothetical protein TYRP_003497 [Tyrophagus putrescentiae]